MRPTKMQDAIQKACTEQRITVYKTGGAWHATYPIQGGNAATICATRYSTALHFATSREPITA